MRICVLAPRFPILSQTFVVDHVGGLLDRGHEVVVVPLAGRRKTDGIVSDSWRAVAKAAAPDPRFRFGGLPTEVAQELVAAAGALRANRRAPWRFALANGAPRLRARGWDLLAATRIERAAPFDVLHAQFGETALIAARMRAAGLFDAPIVTTFHGVDANSRPRATPGLYDPILRECARVTVGSSFMRGVVNNLGFAADSIVVWPQGVDTDSFTPSDRDADGFRVVTVARLVDVKGVDVALRAIAIAREHIHGLRYTVIGDGKRRGALESLARELRVADITTFAGGLSHDGVRDSYACADAFVLLGRTDAEGQTEGQGIAPLEAAASGLPVIVSRSGGLTDSVVDGKTGVLVEPEDPASAAAALVRFATDRAARQRLGAAGREMVVERFSRARTLDIIEDTYRQCVEVGS